MQGLAVVLLFLLAPQLLGWLGISRYYLPLFYIDLIGVSIQVVFMALLNVFFTWTSAASSSNSACCS